MFKCFSSRHLLFAVNFVNDSQTNERDKNGFTNILFVYRITILFKNKIFNKNLTFLNCVFSEIIITCLVY
jgi:hypothetical protein